MFLFRKGFPRPSLQSLHPTPRSLGVPTRFPVFYNTNTDCLQGTCRGSIFIFFIKVLGITMYDDEYKYCIKRVLKKIKLSYNKINIQFIFRVS